MRWPLGMAASALLLSVCATLNAADDQQQLHALLKAVADTSTLDLRSGPGWHWKVEVIHTDNDGKNAVPSTLEMWARDGDLRTTVTSGSESVTALRVGDKLYIGPGDEKMLLAEAFLQMALLQPVPNEVLQPSATLSMTQEGTSKLKIDCLVPSVAKSTSQTVTLQRPYSICVEHGTPNLLVTFGRAGSALYRTQTGLFQGHHVPVHLEVLSGKTKLWDARTTQLSSGGQIDAALFHIGDEMRPLTGPIETSPPNLRMWALSMGPPVYPLEAKQGHRSGSIVFDAVIGADGHVSSLQPTGKPDPILLQAAKDAVQSWVYEPFQVNGLPLEVKSVITVMFSFG